MVYSKTVYHNDLEFPFAYILAYYYIVLPALMTLFMICFTNSIKERLGTLKCKTYFTTFMNKERRKKNYATFKGTCPLSGDMSPSTIRIIHVHLKKTLIFDFFCPIYGLRVGRGSDVRGHAPLKVE